MKPAPFEYKRCESVAHATGLLAQYGDDASILAGGQSLIALMNLRLATPSVLLDVGHIQGLSGIRCDPDGVEVGATARARAVERSDDVARSLPVLPETVRQIGHPQIRSRTTIGGNVAHADPAGELPVLLVGLDGEIELSSEDGSRRVEAADFFEGTWTTCRRPSEMVTSVRFPLHRHLRKRFVEFARRPGDFALAGAFVGLEVAADGAIAELRLALCGVDSTPVRLAGVEPAFTGQPATKAAAREIAESVHGALDPADLPECPAAYRRNLCRVLVERAVQDLMDEGGAW